MSDMSLRALSEAIAGVLGLFRELVMTLLFGLWDGDAHRTMIELSHPPPDISASVMLQYRVIKF